jgi:hypothetical protein
MPGDIIWVDRYSLRHTSLQRAVERGDIVTFT